VPRAKSDKPATAAESEGFSEPRFKDCQNAPTFSRPDKAFMPADRRKRKLVNISLQKAIALRIIAHSLLFAWCVFLVCIGLLYVTGSAESREVFVRLRTLCPLAIGLSIVVIFPAIVYDSIKFGHRMAGPVERLKNMLPLIGVEPLDHVKLRQNDFWQEFATEVNAMLDRVEALRQAASHEQPR
jgi:hypothetical protein